MRVTRIGIGIVLVVVGLIAIAIYFGLDKVSNHPVQSLNFSTGLSELELKELNQLIEPMIKKGYYEIEVQEISDAIANLSWVANVAVIKTSAFGLEIEVIKDQVLFLYNQSSYLNQYLKPRKLTQSIIRQIEQKNIAHIFCAADQIEQAIAFYNQLLEKFQNQGINQGLGGGSIEALQIRELTLTEINQLKIAVDFFAAQDDIKATIHFGTDGIEKKMDKLIENLSEIIKEMLDIKLNRSVELLLDLRYPKGFSLREIN